MSSKILKFTFGVIIFLLVPAKIHAQVVINELGVTGSSDWFELYGYEDTNISGWYLDDEGTATNVHEFPQGTFIGPSTSRIIFVQLAGNKDNRFNDSGETISLFKLGQTDPVDEVSYGGVGEVCLPSEEGSIGRVANVQDYAPTNVWERFSLASKNLTNNNGTLDSCPTPTPTSTPTSTPIVTPSPTPTKTTTPIPTKTATATPKPTPKESPTSTQAKSETPLSQVLGESVTPTPTPSAPDASQKNKIPAISLVFIAGGLLIMGFAVLQFKNAAKADTDSKSLPPAGSVGGDNL